MMRPVRSETRNSARKTGRTALGLLSSCAIGAIMLAVPQSAQAQAFQGSAADAAGFSLVTEGANATQIEIFNEETVINWTPSDVTGTGVIDFLPQGNVATFTNGSGIDEYTVLNRILPEDTGGAFTDRAVSFDGIVLSLVNGVQGGNVWFYSPTGIIIGPNASFTVGGLVLTTDDITFGAASTGGTDLFGPDGEIQFRGVAGGSGFVQIQPNAPLANGPQLNTSNYLALVAPSIEQAGDIASDGSIALIAAEQLDLTVNGGLFDIAITTGTTDANGVVHTGLTTGSASTGVADQQRISIVAVPKNLALTMMLSGDIGYTQAAVATNDGSGIVLSAGFDTDVPTTGAIADNANIEITNAVFQNSVAGYASEGIAVTTDVGELVQFLKSADLHAIDSVALTAEGGDSFIIAEESLSISAGGPGVGGVASLIARGQGEIYIEEVLSVNASSDAQVFDPQSVSDGFGGGILLIAAEGNIIAGSMDLNAEGLGSDDATQGFDGTGGFIGLLAVGDGAISANQLLARAGAQGGFADTAGGNATGGQILMTESSGVTYGSIVGGAGDGGQFLFNDVDLDVSTYGGGAFERGGDAVGGEIEVELLTEQNWSSLLLSASVYAGDPFQSGPGLPAVDLGGGIPDIMGGTANASATAIDLNLSSGGALHLAGNLNIVSEAIGATNTLAGESNRAGGVRIQVLDGGELDVVGDAFIDVDAHYGSDIFIDEYVNTPDQNAGSIFINIDEGDLHFGSLSATANAVSFGATNSPGTGQGGDISVNLTNGSDFSVDDDGSASFMDLSARGEGGLGATGTPVFGGNVGLFVQDSDFNVLGDLLLDSSAVGTSFYSTNLNGAGHIATGGNASIELLAGSTGSASVSVSEFLDVLAEADGRTGVTNVDLIGDGGDSTGGTASVTVGAGNFFANEVLISSFATGGNAGEAGPSAPRLQSGHAQGGTASFISTGGATAIPQMELNAGADGGELLATIGATGPISHGGDGVAGTVNIEISGGAVTMEGFGLIAEAGARGGSAGNFLSAGISGDGGDATAGLIDISISNGATLTTQFLRAGVFAAAGSSDPLGGNASGGTVNLTEIGTAGGTYAISDVSLFAGNNGGSATEISGDATGGQVNITLLTQQNWDNLTVDASTYAGAGFLGSTAISGTATANADAVNLSLLGRGGLTITNNVTLTADVLGAQGTIAGGVNQGGGVLVQIGAGNAFDIGGALDITADSKFGIAGTSLFPDATADMVAGTILIDIDGGILSAESFSATANAFGSGATTSAGDVTGGTVELILANNGGISVFADSGAALAFLSATAEGTNGPQTSNSTGGTVRLSVSDSSVTVDGDLVIGASATSASFPLPFDAPGADATGGNATLELLAGTLGTALVDVTGTLAVNADANAATEDALQSIAGDGGAALGGTASLLVQAGTLNASGIEVTALATGGNSGGSAGLAFQSGAAQGGSANFSQTDGAVSTGGLLVKANGVGGDFGEVSGFGLNGSHGGDGTGGDSVLTLSGGTLDLDHVSVVAAGFGGDGQSGNADPSGDGGDGTGGTAQLVMSAASASFLTVANATSVDARGDGGHAGTGDAGPGLGGNAFGGAATVNISDSEFQLADVSVDASAEVDENHGFDATGGTASFLIADGAATGILTRNISGQLGLFAQTSDSPNGTELGGSTVLDVVAPDRNAGLRIGNLEVDATAANGAAGDGFTLNRDGANLVVVGDANIAVARDVHITAPETLAFNPPRVEVFGNLTIEARDVNQTAAFRVFGNADIDAEQRILFDALTVSGTSDFLAINGAVIVEELRATGLVTASGQFVNLNAVSELNVASAIGTTGFVNLATSSGDLTIASASAVTDANIINSSSSDVYITGPVTGADVSVSAVSDLTVSGLVTAQESASFVAGDEFIANSNILARTIEMKSEAIDIAPTAQIGAFGTTDTISIEADPFFGDTYFGGEEVAGEYSLTDAELSRLFAEQSITLSMIRPVFNPLDPSGGNPGPVTIGDITLGFGPTGNIGSGGTLKIDTDGDVIVAGRVDLTTVSLTDTFSIDPPSIEIIAGAGSISLSNLTGFTQGTLELTGGVIAMADQVTLDAIRGETDLAVISALLDAPSTAVSSEIFLYAGEIDISVDTGLYIQNQGATDAYADRNGFFARELSITALGSMTHIAINGAIYGSDAAVQGLATVGAISINGVTPITTGLFDPLSSVNGCIIGADCGPVTTTPVVVVTPPVIPPVVVVTPPVIIDPPVIIPESDIEPPSNDQLPASESGAGTGPSGTPIVTIAQTQPLITPPLIDEPVTGIGNDDLWDGLCPPGGESCANEGGE